MPEIPILMFTFKRLQNLFIDVYITILVLCKVHTGLNWTSSVYM